MKLKVIIFGLLSLLMYSCGSSDNNDKPEEPTKVEFRLPETAWEGTLTYKENEEVPVYISFVTSEKGNVRTKPPKDSSAKFYMLDDQANFRYSYTDKIIKFNGYGWSYLLHNSWWIRFYDGKSMELVLDPAIDPDMVMKLTRIL